MFATATQKKLRKASRACALLFAFCTLIMSCHYFSHSTSHYNLYTPLTNLCLVLTLCSCAILFTQAYKGSKRSLWHASLLCSAIFLGGILALWHSAGNLYKKEQNIIGMITSEQQATTLLTSKNVDAAQSIPTGIFVRHMRFKDANTIELWCYIWQRYTKSLHKDIERDIVLPDGTDVTAKKIFHEHQGDTEVIGWNINATITQNFDYALYPFDRQHIKLRILHSNFSHGVVLKPDTSAYQSLAPQELPGIDNHLLIKGWNTRFSFFSYHFQTYNTDFGSKHKIHKETNPELIFNIISSRNILSSCIIYLLPIILILLLLFVVTIIHTFSGVSGQVGTVAGLLFTIAFAHSNLRSTIKSDQLMFLEYFYFILYLLMILCSINILMYDIAKDSWIHYQKNIAAKLAYWPCALGLCYLTLLLLLYY